MPVFETRPIAWSHILTNNTVYCQGEYMQRVRCSIVIFWLKLGCHGMSIEYCTERWRTRNAMCSIFARGTQHHSATYDCHGTIINNNVCVRQDNIQTRPQQPQGPMSRRIYILSVNEHWTRRLVAHVQAEHMAGCSARWSTTVPYKHIRPMLRRRNLSTSHERDGRQEDRHNQSGKKLLQHKTAPQNGDW